jgi:hypothetical protein
MRYHCRLIMIGRDIRALAAREKFKKALATARVGLIGPDVAMPGIGQTLL